MKKLTHFSDIEIFSKFYPKSSENRREEEISQKGFVENNLKIELLPKKANLIIDFPERFYNLGNKLDNSQIHFEDDFIKYFFPNSLNIKTLSIPRESSDRITVDKPTLNVKKTTYFYISLKFIFFFS